MGITATTAGTGYGCQSPAITPTIWVTASNAASSVITTSDSNVVHATQSIRCTSLGELHTFDEILAGDVVTNGNGIQTIPASGDSTGYNFTGSMAVKRPTCVCTTLHSFYGRASNDTSVTMHKITFEDGFVFECGAKLSFLSIDSTGVIIKSADALSGGDQVIKCGYPGQGEQPIQSNCTRVITNATITTTGRFINAVSTHWPQALFDNSEVRGVIMLENGVYVIWIPNGGSY